MKARISQVQGMEEYFAIKISDVKLNSPLLDGVELTLRFPAAQYDWLDDPEDTISEIVKRINKEAA